MAATAQDVQDWIKHGKLQKATHIISVCDTFDWDDYPVFVLPNENVDEVKLKYDGKNMQKINEIIDLATV
jgi:hypothetical protein